MENIYELSIRLLSGSYDFNDDIDIFKQYNTKIFKKDENIFNNNKNSSFKAKHNILLIDNIYKEQISNICVDDFNLIHQLIELLKQKYSKYQDIKYEFYISCSINNNQFGFEIDNMLLNILSKYNYSIIISGIAIFD